MSLTDEELHRLVEHLAKINGVSIKDVVAEVSGEQTDDELPVEPAANEAPHKRKRRGPAHWVAWGSALMVMGVLVGSLIVAFLKFVSGPAQADIKPSQAGIPSPTPSAVSASTDQLVGITFILTFPHEFDQVQNLKPDAGALEQYRIGSKDDYKRLVSVSVRPTSSNDLGDDPSYKLRQLETDLYTQTSRTVAGETVAVMIKSGGQEQTMFWLHGGKLLTIAVTSTDPADNVGEFMNQILSNIRWKT